MAFIDFNAAAVSLDWPSFDHVIVGAGAAGILLALKLADGGARVLLVESGGLGADPARDALSTIEETGKRFTDPISTRRRQVGGTTTAWGGQSLAFSPIDFKARDWVAGSGWPIHYSEVAAFYAEANAFMAVDGLNFDSDIRRVTRTPDCFADSPAIKAEFSKISPRKDFYRARRAELAAKVTLLYNAHVTRIDLDEAGRAAAIEIAAFAGPRVVAPVRSLILAVGGLETNRMLLANRHQQAAGLGNASGRLGRGFMEHPCLPVGEIETHDAWRLQSMLAVRYARGGKYGPKLSASEAWQREHRLLNASAALLFIYGAQAFDPYAELRSLRNQLGFKTIDRLGPLAAAAALGLWSLARHGFLYKRGATAQVGVALEQAPDEASRITLGATVDRFGSPLARVNWVIGDMTWATLLAFCGEIGAALETAKLGRLMLYPHVTAANANWRDSLTDVAHHMGGACMSATPQTGVVGPDLAVWGVPNLYVCSAAVFPTGSHSNPTLTVLALACRLARRLTQAAR